MIKSILVTFVFAFVTVVPFMAILGQRTGGMVWFVSCFICWFFSKLVLVR